MRILIESIQDVENYLNNLAIEDIVSDYGKDFVDFGYNIIDFIEGKVLEKFNESISVEYVVVCKVIGDDVDIVSQNHPVIVYNGYYYDYGAQEFNDLFSNLITEDNLPVVQKVIRNDDQINERLSSVKGYVMLGY